MIFRSKEPSNGKASKTNRRQKMMTETNPEDCHVKTKFTLDPSAEVSKSAGGSMLIVFVTATCPNCSSCVVHSTRNGLKLSNRMEQKTIEAPKPIMTCKN